MADQVAVAEAYGAEGISIDTCRGPTSDVSYEKTEHEDQGAGSLIVGPPIPPVLMSEHETQEEPLPDDDEDEVQDHGEKLYDEVPYVGGRLYCNRHDPRWCPLVLRNRDSDGAKHSAFNLGHPDGLTCYLLLRAMFFGFCVGLVALFGWLDPYLIGFFAPGLIVMLLLLVLELSFTSDGRHCEDPEDIAFDV